MEIVYSDEAQKDINFWKKSRNKAVQQKIQQLLNSIKETPYEGNGKPEPLKYGLSGLWSRRINLEHRIVYQVLEDNNRIKIYSLKGRYI